MIMKTPGQRLFDMWRSYMLNSNCKTAIGFCIYPLIIFCCVVSARANAGPVRAGVAPFDAEKKAMQQLVQQDTSANRQALARVRYRCALDLYHHYRTKNDTGALELAAAYAASAAELDHGRADHWIVLGQLLATLADAGYTGSRVLAIQALEEAVRLKPDNVAGHIMLGLNLMLDQQYRAALDQLEPVIMQWPERIKPQLVMAAGICYIHGPLTRRGVGFFDRMLAGHPNLPHIRLARAVLLEHQNRRDEALAALQAVFDDPRAGAADRNYARDLKALWQQYGTPGEVD